MTGLAAEGALTGFVRVPVLVCLPNTEKDLPAEPAALHGMILQTVLGHGPDGSIFRVGGTYAGLVRTRAGARNSATVVLINPVDGPTGETGRCDGGSAEALLYPGLLRPRDGQPWRLVSPDGRWYGPQPWRPPTTLGPVPDAFNLARMIAPHTVLVVVEMQAPLPPPVRP